MAYTQIADFVRHLRPPIQELPELLGEPCVEFVCEGVIDGCDGAVIPADKKLVARNFP